MAITASFAADFSAFNSEVNKAQSELQSFEGQTAQTGTAMGQLGTVTTTTAGPINTLGGSFRQFDNILGAMGIHITPVVRGIEELGQASGKTAGEIGLLGTAGLVAGAALGGWKIGRWIADLTGLDEAISNSAAKLMGWGDLAAETAGAKADVLARATKNAGREITDFAEALKINQKAFDAHQKAAEDNAKAYDAWAKANQDVTIAAQDWRAVLNTISGTTVEAAKASLDLGVSQKSVATAYELTAPQIAAVVSALAAEKEALKASEAEHARITAALKQHWDGVLAIRDKVFGKEAIDQAQQWVEAIHIMGGSLDTLTHAQLAELVDAMHAAMDAMARTGTLTDQQSSSFGALMIAAENAQAALRPLVDTTNDLAKAQYDQAIAQDAADQAMSKAKDTAKELSDGVRQATAATNEFIGSAFPSAESLTAVSRDPRSFMGAPIGRTMQTGISTNTPWAAIQPGVHVEPGAFVLNYPIVNDPAAMDQLGRLVGDSIMSRVTRTGAVV